LRNMKTVKLDNKRELTEDGRILYGEKLGRGIPKKYWGKVVDPPVGEHGYAVVNAGRKRYLAHRLVYERFVGPIPPKMDVDHIDGNKLNNHPSNLRLMTHSDNCKAARKPYKSNSKYRGVYWNKSLGYWCAAIASPKIVRYFDNEESAARAWNEMAKQHGYAKEALNIL